MKVPLSFESGSNKSTKGGNKWTTKRTARAAKATRALAVQTAQTAVVVNTASTLGTGHKLEKLSVRPIPLPIPVKSRAVFV